MKTNELSEQELGNISGGAVDAFIWFEQQQGMKPPIGETKD